jgi:hypothetical protein
MALKEDLDAIRASIEELSKRMTALEERWKPPPMMSTPFGPDDPEFQQGQGNTLVTTPRDDSFSHPDDPLGIMPVVEGKQLPSFKIPPKPSKGGGFVLPSELQSVLYPLTPPAEMPPRPKELPLFVKILSPDV